MDMPDVDEPFDPDLSALRLWERVPERVRRSVEQHVSAHLPADMLAKLRQARTLGTAISADPAFFHFGGGMIVRNLCRERLGDDKLAIYCGLGGNWDSCYVVVLAAIAASGP